MIQVTHLLSSQRYLPDFDNYYHTVQDIKRGINPYEISYMQTQGPPLTFLYYLPYSLVNLSTAQTIFLISNIVCGFATCIVLSKKYFLVFSLILFASFLSRYSLQIGQPSLTIAFLVSLALNRASPIWMVAATIVKAFVGFAIIGQRGWLPIALILLILSLTIIPINWTTRYMQNNFIHNISSSENTNYLNYENQTLKSTLARLHLPSFYPIVWLGIFAIGIYTAFTKRTVALGILFSFLLTPVLWQHYLPIIFPIFILSFQKRFSIFNILSFILWWPDLRITNTMPHNLFYGILASHFYVSLVLLTIANYGHQDRNV